MATDKTFTVVGISTFADGTKVRFANDAMRVKVLMKNGHTDPILIELPEAMTKVAAVKFMAELPEFAGEVAVQAIADYLDKHDKQPKVKVEVKKAVKAAVTKKPAAVKATAPADTATKAEKAALVKAALADAEDAPF